MTEPKPEFLYEEHPDHPGWMKWGFKDATRYNAFLGEMMVRIDEDGRARVRMTPQHQHSNLANVIHGGAMLGFIDVSLFAAARGFGLITAGTEPMEARVELLRETGRLLFLRGLVVQGDDAEVMAEFSGTIRKPSAPRR